MSYLNHKHQATNTSTSTTTTTSREDSPASGPSGFMGGQNHQTSHQHATTGEGGGFNGASRKLEELFVYWLSQKETTEMVEHCVTAVRQGQALPCESALEVRAGRGGRGRGRGRMI